MSLATPFTNSTTLNCAGGGVTDAIGASGGWCIRANGHPRMQTCCSQLGNGTLFVQHDCHVWCDVESPDPGRFSDCLVSGTNSTGVDNVGCSLNHRVDEDDESAGTLAYSTPKATLSALFCGVLALSMLCV